MSPPLGINILDVNEYYEGEKCYYSSYTDTSNPNNTNGNSVTSSFSHISKLGISTYKDPKNSWELIRKDNINKVGVYCWFNLVNGKFYIGSSNHLHLRLRRYYKNWYYSSRPNTLIVRALSRYGMENFSLIILEYTTYDNVINCEQQWIDSLKPEYNINLVAGNSSGYKHTPPPLESKIKMRKMRLGRKHSEETSGRAAAGCIHRPPPQGGEETSGRAAAGCIHRPPAPRGAKKLNSLWANLGKAWITLYGKTHSEKSLALLRVAAKNRKKLPVPGIEVEITDLESNITTTYESIRKAASAINSDIKSLSRYEKSQILKGINTPYRGRYIIDPPTPYYFFNKKNNRGGRVFKRP